MTLACLLVRDRKMYVAPTPFVLTTGTAAQTTLIVPVELEIDSRLERVGELVRIETDNVIVGYSFDLRLNELTPTFEANPAAGQEHRFAAYREKGHPGGPVAMMAPEQIEAQLTLREDE